MWKKVPVEPKKRLGGEFGRRGAGTNLLANLAVGGFKLILLGLPLG
jgi:hypothetical protein